MASITLLDAFKLAKEIDRQIADRRKLGEQAMQENLQSPEQKVELEPSKREQ